MKKNEKGFERAIVERIAIRVLVGLIIGLLVAVGWLIFDRQKGKDHGDKNAITKSEQKEDTNTPRQASNTLDVTPTLGVTGMTLKTPDGWSASKSGQSGDISRTINGQVYTIQFFLATDSQTGNFHRNYAHFVNDYASDKNAILQTVSGGKTELYLVRSSDDLVVLRTCKELTDTTCYLKHDGLPLIARILQEKPGAQTTTGFDDFDSADTKAALSDFEIIARSIEGE